MKGRQPRILLGVTVDLSLGLLRGFPAYLAGRGWDVHVVCAPGPRLDALEGTPGVTVHAIAMARDPSLLIDLRSLFSWVGLVRNVRPTVISVGTPKAGLLGVLAGRLMRVPDVVYMLRGLRLETETGLRRRILWGLERLTMALAGRVLAVSPSLREAALDARLVKAEKISVLGAGSSNGVDISRFEDSPDLEADVSALRSELALVPGVPVVGFVGRLTAAKGLEALADAHRELDRLGVDHQLLIVGGIDHEDGAASLVKLQEGTWPAVQTGFVDDPSIYYRLMDVFCLPTLKEGFPNVVLEAGAAGLPTVTTNATGAIDSIVENETGLLVPAGDGVQLAAALQKLIGDQELRLRMGQAASRHVAENFANEVVWDNTVLYLQNGLREPAFRGRRR